MTYTQLDAVNLELFRDAAMVENQRLDDKAKLNTKRRNVALNVVISTLSFTLVLLTLILWKGGK